MKDHLISKSIAQMKQSLEKCPEQILEHPDMGICICLENGKILYVNKKFSEIQNVNAVEMLEKRIQEFCSYTSQHLPDFLKQFEQLQHIEAQEMYINGSYYLYKIQSVEQDQYMLLIITLVDITIYKRLALGLEQSNRQLEHIRLLDRTTQLNNFTAFESRIQDIYHAKTPQTIGMVLADIDGFKRFHQENGFEYGDAAIKKISQCMERLIAGDTETLYYLGGNEFMFVLPNIQSWNLFTFAEQVCAEVYKLNLYFSSGVDHRLTMSLAIQNSQSGGCFDIDYFLVDLKKLILVAKQRGGNCWVDKNLVDDMITRS